MSGPLRLNRKHMSKLLLVLALCLGSALIGAGPNGEAYESESDCVLCGLGKCSATSGMSSCVSCGAGKYLTTEGNDEESDCELCGTSTYSAQQGQTSAAT